MNFCTVEECFVEMLMCSTSPSVPLSQVSVVYIDDFRFSAKLWPWGKFLAFPNAKTVRAERGGGNTSQKRTTSTKRCINVALTMLLLYHLEAKDVFSTNKAEQWRRKSARPSNLRNHENSTYCPYMF